MIAKLHVPTFPLNHFIESFFYYSGYNPVHSLDRFLPDGNVQIVFDLTEYPKYIHDNQTLKEIQSCRNVWFSGFRTEPITIPSGQQSEMLIITFHKGRAFPFLSEPMGQLTNYVVDAELVLKNEILDLRELIKDCESIEQKFLAIEANLLRNYNLTKDPFIDYAVSNITAQPNQCSMKELSNKVGYSQKHLIKIFRDRLGVTPKNFLKVIRFQKVINEIELQKYVNWTSVGLDCGFYDQSHFIADFKKFSGFTPNEYLKQKGGFLNYVPVK